MVFTHKKNGKIQDHKYKLFKEYLKKNLIKVFLYQITYKRHILKIMFIKHK